jgi:hypothetical protein
MKKTHISTDVLSELLAANRLAVEHLMTVQSKLIKLRADNGQVKLENAYKRRSHQCLVDETAKKWNQEAIAIATHICSSIGIVPNTANVARHFSGATRSDNLAAITDWVKSERVRLKYGLLEDLEFLQDDLIRLANSKLIAIKHF